MLTPATGKPCTCHFLHFYSSICTSSSSAAGKGKDFAVWTPRPLCLAFPTVTLICCPHVGPKLSSPLKSVTLCLVCGLCENSSGRKNLSSEEAVRLKWLMASPSLQHLSSRLAALAVEHKLCHSFQTFNTSYSDTGLFGFHFVADPLSIDDMMFCAQGEW